MTRKGPPSNRGKSGKPKLRRKTLKDLDPKARGKRVKGGWPKPTPNPATFGQTCWCPNTEMCPVPLPYPNKG